MADENAQRALEAIEVAKNTGKIKKGINEVTKALERGTAQLVAFAKDVQPKEIILHLPLLAKEKGTPCFEVSSKEELGVACGVGLSTSAVAVINPGDAKKLIDGIKREMAAAAKPKKEEKKEEKAEKKAEPAKEEKKAEKPAEKKAEKKESKPADKKEEPAKEEKKAEKPAEKKEE